MSNDSKSAVHSLSNGHLKLAPLPPEVGRAVDTFFAEPIKIDANQRRHDIRQTVTDAFYIHRVLNPRGVVAFHDSSLFSTGAAVQYLALECGYSVLELPADSTIKRIARRLRYVNTVGVWYARHVASKL